MAKGTVTLADVAARATHINIACSRCERRGRYRLSRLIASYGEHFPMTDLGSEIADCPQRYAAVTQRCDVFYPGLRKIMSDDDQEAAKPGASHASDDDDDL
ncbi:hypothetical protein [Paraburkholderia terrae]|uniref:Uncharacterized protein n=1 Tax=Paraburkholderia terrae TaxID=311230 RepID=A0A2I8ETH2_9BURK|nr:hypothetical protein [Paraburkholderia terrae]AUT62866.1 hypothetical protein C2L65_25150 [Paraburkholderia terrae]